MGRDLALLSEKVLVKRVGLIVNPIAGLGGSVGLKGTDGVAEQALRLGARPHAGERAETALRELLPLREELELLCAGGEMGEDIARSLGFQVKTIYFPPTHTSSPDTVAAARAMDSCELLLFAGGDGTARDIVSSGVQLPVIGIPAGVKIHSPVYALRPESAGRLALRFLRGGQRRLREAEVVDIDEEAYRQGLVRTRLYGYLNVPDGTDLLQHGKASSPESERAQQLSIAHEMIERMRPGVAYLVGPGSTTRALMDELGQPNTLIGVDLLQDQKLVASDLCEADILAQLDRGETHLIVTPTGGQGYLFGRGNQQLSAAVLRRLGKERIHILATQEKLFQLSGRPLLVDTGDAQVDELLCGYYRVIVRYHEEQMCRVSKEPGE